MILELETNLSSDARRIWLGQLALDGPLEGGLQDGLAKALGDRPLIRPDEPYLGYLFDHAMDLYDETLTRLRDLIADWISGLEPATKGFGLLLKARRTPRRPLTGAELAQLQDLIQETFSATVQVYNSQPFTVPLATLTDWRRRGIIGTSVIPRNFIRNAFVFGRLKKALDTRGIITLPDIIKAVTTFEPGFLDLAVIKAAESRAATHIVALGGRLAAQAASQVAQANQHAIHDMVIQAVAGKLPITTAEGLPSGLFTGDWRGLASELYHQFKGTPQAMRDWDRIAYYETQDAFHTGIANDLLRKYGSDLRVTRTPAPNACRYCQTLYIGKEFRLADLIGNGTNIGRRASLIGQAGGWLPVTGLTHPWCRCSSPELVFPQ